MHPYYTTPPRGRSGPAARSIASRFLSHFHPSPACWLWINPTHPKGYGTLSISSPNAHAELAHRIAWVLASGAPIPAGHTVLHTCDTPACVRNDEPGTYTVGGQTYPRFGHLFLATQAVNMEDMAAKGRHARLGGKALGDANGSRRHPERLPRGEANTATRLTANLVREMRARCAAGESVAAIARSIPISKNAAHCAIHRKTWRHIE